MNTFFKAIRNTIKYWYVPAIIGLLFIILGIYLFSVPIATYYSLVFLFSLSFVVSGALEIFFSVNNRNELEGWGWYLAGGIFSLAIGILLMARPEIAATALPFYIGFVLLFRSVQGLGFAFELKNYGILRWGDMALLSVLGIIFSMILLASPVFTGISLVAITAFTFIFVGIGAVVLAVRLKKLRSLPQKLSKELKEKIEDLKVEYYEYLGKNDR